MLKINLATVLKTCNFIKKRLQHGCFPASIPKVLGTNFLIEQLWRLLLNYVLLSERICKKRKLVERLPLMSLPCFMYKYKSLQDIQLPQEHLSFQQNFMMTKYLKQEVNDDLSVCEDERSPCGLSITRDIKIYQYHVIKR